MPAIVVRLSSCEARIALTPKSASFTCPWERVYAILCYESKQEIDLFVIKDVSALHIAMDELGGVVVQEGEATNSFPQN